MPYIYLDNKVWKALKVLGKANEEYIKRIEKELIGKKLKKIEIITSEELFPSVILKFEGNKEILCNFNGYNDKKGVR